MSSMTDYIYHKTQQYLDSSELSVSSENEFFESLEILSNEDFDTTEEVYQSAIQTVAQRAAWLSPDDIDRIPLKAFAQVISQIKEFPLGGERGIFCLCCQKVKNRMELFFSEECRPPLFDSIHWKALPPTIVQSFIRQTNNLSVINSIYFTTEIISRAPKLALIRDNHNHITRLFWHPGDISNQVIDSFTMECENPDGISYTPSFVVQARAIKDLVHVSVALEKRSTVATLALDSFTPTIEVDTYEVSTSLSDDSTSRLMHFTQFDCVEGRACRKLVNVAAPSIVFTFSNHRTFHLLYSHSDMEGVVGIWGTADAVQSVAHLEQAT